MLETNSRCDFHFFIKKILETAYFKKGLFFVAEHQQNKIMIDNKIDDRRDLNS
jgi:hypothetical protein